MGKQIDVHAPHSKSTGNPEDFSTDFSAGEMMCMVEKRVPSTVESPKPEKQHLGISTAMFQGLL